MFYIDMSYKLTHVRLMADELSLEQLAAASGLERRTIRSWVAQRLVPSPLNRGPMARYPAETLERLLAIRYLQKGLGLTLAEIGQELLVAPPGKLTEWAEKAQSLVPETVAPSPVATSTALEYIRRIREGERVRSSPPFAARADHQSAPRRVPPSALSATRAVAPDAGDAARQGFDALEYHLGADRLAPVRKARAEEWLRLPVTPDVELAVRGPLDDEARTRVERCADLIRTILLGTMR